MNKFIVGDADSLIALAYKDDINHQKARNLAQEILVKGYQIIYPNTAVLEAITTLKRALSLPDKAHLLARQYLQGAFIVEYVDENLQREATNLFDQKAQSKKNTIFDAIVATVAKKTDADAIFSFDEWYSKLGFSSLEKYVEFASSL